MDGSLHGGTTPPEKIHPFAHWGMVAARKRIGMINLSSLPSMGKFVAISKNTIRQANPCVAERDGTGLCKWSGERGLKDLFGNWSSGIWNPDAKRLIVVSGGEWMAGS